MELDNKLQVLFLGASVVDVRFTSCSLLVLAPLPSAAIGWLVPSSSSVFVAAGWLVLLL